MLLFVGVKASPKPQRLQRLAVAGRVAGKSPPGGGEAWALPMLGRRSSAALFHREAGMRHGGKAVQRREV